MYLLVENKEYKETELQGMNTDPIIYLTNTEGKLESETSFVVIYYYSWNNSLFPHLPCESLLKSLSHTLTHYGVTVNPYD